MPVTFIQSGHKTYVESTPEGLVAAKLKPAIYSIENSREEGFFLLKIAESYTLPEKMYGEHEKAANRVLLTHYSKPNSTGVLLTGLKGTGKTLFIKVICNLMISQRNVPVIQVNKPYPGEEIFNFIENLGECAVVFDEFGKNYDRYGRGPGSNSQDGLLGLLDGMTKSKRLHLFTENDIEKISEYLLNRPGRVHYHFKYSRLPESIIRELCKDMGVNEAITNELIGLSKTLKTLSFDVVKCLIEEWKLYGGSLKEHLEILNITRYSNPKDQTYKLISVTNADGEKIDITKVKMIKNRDDHYSIYHDKDANDRYAPCLADLNFNDPVSVEGNTYVFVTEHLVTVVVEKITKTAN